MTRTSPTGKEAQEAHDDLKFIKEEADNFYKGMQQQQQQQLQEAAKEAVRVLEQDIPDGTTNMTTSGHTLSGLDCPKLKSIPM